MTEPGDSVRRLSKLSNPDAPYLTIGLRIELSLWDRIRLLFSGLIFYDALLETEHPIGSIRSVDESVVVVG